MAVENPAPAVAAPTTTPPESEFQANALALLEARDAPPAPEAAPAPEAKPEETVKVPEVKAEETVKVPEEAPLKKGFDALALEKAKMRRKEAETAERLKLLEKYENAKTPLDLLMAKGFSYDDATRQLLKGEYKEAAKKEPEESEVIKEVRQLKQQLAEERAQSTRQEIQNKIMSYAKANADKFPFTAAKQAEHLAFQYLREYVAETNELPGKDIEESIALSFQAVEADLEKEITAAANILTKVRKPAISVPGSNEKAVQTAASGQATQKTLTNSLVSPGKPAREPAVPRTAEEYQQAAVALLESQTR